MVLVPFWTIRPFERVIVPKRHQRSILD
ncbi:hypothetical protein [Formosa sp. 4Alg 33]